MVESISQTPSFEDKVEVLSRLQRMREQELQLEQEVRHLLQSLHIHHSSLPLRDSMVAWGGAESRGSQATGPSKRPAEQQ